MNKLRSANSCASTIEAHGPRRIAIAEAAGRQLVELVRRDVRPRRIMTRAASAPQEMLAVSILWPASPVIYKREIAQARQRFAKTPWMATWHEGEQMTLAEACAACIPHNSSWG